MNISNQEAINHQKALDSFIESITPVLKKHVSRGDTPYNVHLDENGVEFQYDHSYRGYSDTEFGFVGWDFFKNPELYMKQQEEDKRLKLEEEKRIADQKDTERRKEMFLKLQKEFGNI